MAAPSVRHTMDGATRPAPRPQAAELLFVVGRLLEYDDTETIANMIAYGTFRLECLAARDAVPH